MTDKLIVHYIYINKHDKYDTVIPEEVMQLTKLYVKYDNLEFKIHTYVSLYEELKEYNTAYARLLSTINPLFATFMTDLGRIFVLWKYGGIYHDAHFYIDNVKFIIKIKETLHKCGFVFESHPIKRIGFACRGGNMAAVKNNSLFLKILHKQFENLQRVEQELICDINKRHNMWRELAMIFLEQLLIEAELSDSAFTMKIVPNNEEFCFLWDTKMLPRFYNNPTMEDHWSVLQNKLPVLMI